MLDILRVLSSQIIVGGLAASALVCASLVGVALGGEGSRISPERKLLNDSDAKLFGLLFAIGAACGVAVAVVSGFATDWIWIAPTGAVSFILGGIVAFSRIAKLNEQYLARAHDNFEQGKYKEAIEDASEVARSSERLRSEADELMEAARARRREQPIGSGVSGSQDGLATSSFR